MANTHLIIEAHLQLDETILNPDKVGPKVAAKIAALLEELYAEKKATVDANDTRTRKTKAAKHVRKVHTLVVSHRTAQMTDRLDTQE